MKLKRCNSNFVCNVSSYVYSEECTMWGSEYFYFLILPVYDTLFPDNN